jgi:hypothetical protein
MARTVRTSIAHQWLKIALLALAIVWLSSQVHGIWRKQVVAREAVSTTRAELLALEKRQGALAAQVAELGTPRGQEAAMRHTMRVARPGEEVIIVVPEEAPLPPPPPTFWESVRDFMPW